jgi:hypothetical protein
MPTTQFQSFGNTLANQRANIWIWTILSAAVFTLFVVLSKRQLSDFVIALLFAALPAAFFVTTLLFRLHFDADSVSHLFLGRVSISKKPVSELRRVDIGRSIGAKLTFHDGSSIRFLGADVLILRDMCRYIQERWPGQVEERWNPALSALLAFERKPRRDA